MSLLDITGLSHSYGDSRLYSDSDLSLNRGEHMGIVGQNGTVNTDSLTQTFCQNVLVLHINQLIFQRGASAVHYKNFHIKFLHSFLKPSTQKGGKAD